MQEDKTQTIGPFHM